MIREREKNKQVYNLFIRELENGNMFFKDNKQQR